MPNTLSLSWSTRLLRYYFGPEHPLKLRLFDLLHRLLGRPSFTVPFGRALLHLDIHDFIPFAIMRDGDFEPEVWNALAEQAVEREVVWDVGANIGSVGLRAAQDRRVTEVHCFEPNPVTLKRLVRNVHSNPDLRVVVHGFALGDCVETAPLFVGLEKNRGVAGFFPHWTHDSVQVQCFSGDDLVERGLCPAPTLIKLDVEGFELKVLQGLQRTLRSQPPKAIVFENHLNEEGNLIDQASVDFLESLGMTVLLVKCPDERRTVSCLAVRGK